MKIRPSWALFFAVIVAIVSLTLIAPFAEAQRRRAVTRHSSDSFLTGRVTDATSGARLQDVELTLQNVTRTTNAEGLYEFGELATGTWPITIARWGYQSMTTQVDIAQGSNSADFQLQLLPYVTLTRKDGSVERFATETIKFGYNITFVGNFSSDTLKVCTGDPNQPLALPPGDIAVIEGPAERVTTPCCPGSTGEKISVRRKSGQPFDAIVLESCPPYDTYILGRSIDSGAGVYSRLTETARVEFPQ